MKEAKKTVAAIITLLALGCAAQQETHITPIQVEPNLTWSIMESATTNTEIIRAYARFNEETKNKQLRAESYAGMAIIALRYPTAIGTTTAASKNIALIYAEKALLADANSPRAHYAQGLALTANKKYALAEQFLAALSSTTYSTCDYHILSATIKAAKDGAANAIPEIRHALSCETGKQDRQNMLKLAADAASQTARYKEAAELYEEAISIEPHDQATQLQYARMLMSAGENTKAKEILQKINKATGSRTSYALLSRIHTQEALNYMGNSQYDMAEKEYKMALAWNPDNPEAYRSLMIINADYLKRCDDALTYADAILSKDQKDNQAIAVRNRCEKKTQ